MIVYMECDKEANGRLRAEETEDRIYVKGNAEDPQQHKLIQGTLREITHETPSLKVHREITILN